MKQPTNAQVALKEAERYNALPGPQKKNKLFGRKPDTCYGHDVSGSAPVWYVGKNMCVTITPLGTAIVMRRNALVSISKGMLYSVR